MANPQQNNLSSDQQFAELEYMIQKYYNEYCAKVVSSEVKSFDDQQRLEYQKKLDEHMKIYRYSSTIPPFSWDNKTADDLLSSIRHRLDNDAALQADIQKLTAAWKAVAIDRMGQDEYDRQSSQCANGDLAMTFMENRMRQMIVEQLAKRKVPQSSLEYIMGKAIDYSFISWMPSQQRRHSDLDNEINQMAEAMYDASTVEKTVGVGLGLLIDTPAMGMGGKVLQAGKAAVGFGKAAAAAAKTDRVVVVGFHASKDAVKQSAKLSPAALDRARKVAKSAGSLGALTGAGVLFSGCSTPDEQDRAISAAVTGSADSFSQSRQKASKVNPQNSLFVHAVNDSLDNKVKMKEYHVKFDEASCDKFLYDLRDAHQGNADLAMFNVEYAFKNAHIRYNADAPIPQWMMDKSEEELLQLSDNFAAYALEMQRCGSHSLTIGKGADTTYTMDQMAQRAYDYTHAAEVKRHERLAALSDEERLDGGLHPIAPVEPIPSDKKDKDAPYFNAVARKFNYWISCGEDIEPPAPSPSAIIEDGLSDNGFDGLNCEAPVPEWMGDKTPEELLRSSASFYAIARSMLKNGTKEKMVNDKMMTLAEVSQRSYDYARAAEAAIEEKKALLQQRQERQEQVQSQGQSAGNDLRQDGADEGSDLMGMMNTSQGQWGGLMDMLGLSGAGEMGRNLGYTLAMLPEMLLAMLTGKNDKLKLENNIFPLMAIFGGLFMKNPILKFLMIGLGGLNILNKGFGTFSGRDSEQAQQAQQAVYKSYPPEPLNRRIVFDGVKDNCVFVKIDGQAWTVRISDNALDAYYSGSLSKEALCNRVLQDYDAFAKHSSESYERLDATQEHDQQRGLSMG